MIQEKVKETNKVYEAKQKAVIAKFGEWNGESHFIVTSKVNHFPGDRDISEPTHFVVQANTPEHACAVVQACLYMEEGKLILTAKAATTEALLQMFTFMDGIANETKIDLDGM